MRRHASTDRGVSRIVEKQMRNWELGRSKRDVQPTVAGSVHPFLAISRMLGAGGGEIGRKLSVQLDWPLFDKEILDAMAGEDVFRRRLYESMDERDLGWLEEVFRSQMPTESPHNDYYHQLVRTVMTIARQGRAVFLGRCVGLFLPIGSGLRVRIVATEQSRVRQLAVLRHCPLEDARIAMESTDLERTRFARKNFGIDTNDAHLYDIVLNTDRLSTDDCVVLILSMLQRRKMIS